MAELCPTCRQQLPQSAGVVIDAAAGLVVAGGRLAVLAPGEAAILLCLQQKAPRLVTKQALLDELCLHEVDQPEIKIVDVYVCKIRKKLKPLGIDIQTIWGRGYRMLPLEAA